MDLVARGYDIDLADPWFGHLLSEDEVPIEPTASGHYGGEAHPNLEGDSSLLWEHGDIPDGPNRFSKEIEQASHGGVGSHEQLIELKASARM